MAELGTALCLGALGLLGAGFILWVWIGVLGMAAKLDDYDEQHHGVRRS